MTSSKTFRLLGLATICVTLAACAASSVFGGKINHLMNFDAARLAKGQGAVMLHAINGGGLIATRWFKIDDPERKHSFTVYRTDRHRALDRADTYDVVMVEPGTYVLYSIFGNCEEGLRPGSTDWDEPMRDNVATSLGMVSRLRSWKPGGDVSTSVGIWGGGGSVGAAQGIDIGGVGTGAGPGVPIAICNLRSNGFVSGRPALATITVKPGELVYAGELHIEYGDNGRCESFGNWMTENETREYCGADWVNLRVRDSFSSLGRSFIEKHLGPAAADRAVVRLAEPGSQVSVK